MLKCCEAMRLKEKEAAKQEKEKKKQDKLAQKEQMKKQAELEKQRKKAEKEGKKLEVTFHRFKEQIFQKSKIQFISEKLMMFNFLNRKRRKKQRKTNPTAETKKFNKRTSESCFVFVQ
jgi:hypothetical protein